MDTWGGDGDRRRQRDTGVTETERYGERELKTENETQWQMRTHGQGWRHRLGWSLPDRGGGAREGREPEEIQGRETATCQKR